MPGYRTPSTAGVVFRVVYMVPSEYSKIVVSKRDRHCTKGVENSRDFSFLDLRCSYGGDSSESFEGRISEESLRIVTLVSSPVISRNALVSPEDFTLHNLYR